ncbi:DUF1294 domain-containing protein [Fictibacillus aquaticus]|uniref:DUF1294 domain-containing protein n=1 Tax=Fictibacillus aquaticus TaxID=2021314 RepID=A0A235FA28_9BACL|nr:DUF1294 domain-containing protein [Fictibacillus aquaticus]OYD58148.1 hypothetical protein CGZ90_09715 [Fictibacillus aquaticus]
MKGNEIVLYLYLIIINTLSYRIMKKDKEAAQNGEWRTPEAALWMFALIGGAPGMWLCMKKRRHKTKHASFKTGIPLLSFITAFVAGLFL